MAGSPIKRARREGLALPNGGDRPPQYPRARARENENPTDAELTSLARATLWLVMQCGTFDRDRVAAARVALEAARDTKAPADDLEKLSDAELAKLIPKAMEAIQ